MKKTICAVTAAMLALTSVSPTQPVKPNVGAIKNLKRTQYTTNSLSFKWDKVSGSTLVSVTSDATVASVAG